MLIIEGIRIKNFRVLKDVTLGRTKKQSTNSPLTPIIAVIGKNGSGKSTLFDAFVFLKECFSVGVEAACNHKNRGGVERLISSGCNAPICFELTYQNSADEMHFSYELVIDLDQSGRPVIIEEKLIQSLEPDMHCVLLHFQNSKGIVWADNKNDQTKEPAHLQLELTDNNRPAVSVFGSLKDYPQLTHLKQYIQNWYITDFSMDAARSILKAGPQKQLSDQGDNIANVVQFMEREHKARFHNIIKTISDKIPGIEKIKTKTTDDGRLLLCFNDKGFSDSFLANQMSNGTLKMFAYLLLLELPNPPQFICIEEPENGLYHKLLEILAAEFRHAMQTKKIAQIFITTHQPYFVDGLSPEETWLLEKGSDGFSTIQRASDNKIVKAMVDEGLPLGGLWYSDYMDAR
jgi:predicted ATPase